jgi:hypothetical protein
LVPAAKLSPPHESPVVSAPARAAVSWAAVWLVASAVVASAVVAVAAWSAALVARALAVLSAPERSRVPASPVSPNVIPNDPWLPAPESTGRGHPPSRVVGSHASPEFFRAR